MEWIKDNWQIIIAIITFLIANVGKMYADIKAVKKCWKDITDPNSPGGKKITQKEQETFNPIMAKALDSATIWYNFIIGLFNKGTYKAVKNVKKEAKKISG